jgi:hypothetical protein
MIRRYRKFAALFVAAVCLFSPPLLGAFNREGALWGLPLLPLYLFCAWGAVVGAAWWLDQRRGR